MDLWFIVIIVIGIALFAPVILGFFRKPKAGATEPHTIRVTVTDVEFVVEDLKDKSSITIPWASVQRITVITTDQGPFVDDLFYHIVYAGGEVTLPSEAQNIDAFTSHMMTLSGFDGVAYTAAIRSTENNRFVVCFQLENDNIL